MLVAEVQFTPWDKVYWFNPAGSDLCVGDYVMVNTDLGMELGAVVSLKELTESEIGTREIKNIVRKANLSDLDKAKERNTHKKEVMDTCRLAAQKNNLDMKLVDVHFSFDGGRITFAFIAGSRLDFRGLVKDLTHIFQKSIRMQQLGVRDEAKYLGSWGPCGRGLCCQNFLKDLGQVSAEYVEIQQLMHRGSDRLSGICGRLRCCLRYEKETYEKLTASLPAIGTKVRTDHGRGVIVAHNILRQSVNVQLEGEGGATVEIPIKKNDQEEEKKDG